jgi:hypothetical protein
MALTEVKLTAGAHPSRNALTLVLWRANSILHTANTVTYKWPNAAFSTDPVATPGICATVSIPPVLGALTFPVTVPKGVGYAVIAVLRGFTMTADTA